MGGDGQKFFKRSPPKRLRLFSRGFADILFDANRAMDILAKGLGRLGIPSIHPYKPVFFGCDLQFSG